MADRPPGASSGKPIKMQDGEPQHHDGSFRKYMETKLRKLGEQFDAQTGSGGAESTLFAGVAIYVNGLTRPSHAELKTIMAQHGGRFSNYYSRSSITHIICENLPDAKVKQYERERSPTPVVRPEWIVRCLEQGRLLPINDFALWQLRDAPGQLTLKGFAAGGALPQGPQPPNPVSAAVSGVDAAPSIPPPAPRPEVAAAQGAQRRTYNAQELAVAHEIAAKMRSECDVLKGPPRSSKDDPNFVETYYRASRLHFIGSWKARLEALMVSVAASEAPDPAAWTLGKARTIMHLDMDCFFASVAEAGHPEFRDKPIAVSHSNSAHGSGEVSSANYEARKYGVSASMFIAKAKELCPDLIVVPYEFEKYEMVSEQVYRILLRYTSCVQPISCDEAFLDVTGLGDPLTLASDMRADIAAATGCTASTGIGPNMLLARIATKRAKPNGQFMITAQEAQPYLLELPVGELPGVGWSTERKLAELGVHSVRDVHATTKQALQGALGAKAGALLWDFAHGRDSRKVEPPKGRKSVGAEVNWGVRFESEEDPGKFLATLSSEVTQRMQQAGVKGRTITLKVKRRKQGWTEPAKFLGMGACDSLSRSVTLARFTDAAEELCREATALLRALRVPYTEIRGLGLTVTKLNTESASAGAKPSAFPPAKMVAPPATIVGHAAPVGRTSPIDKLFGKGGQQQAASRSGAVPLPAPIEEEQEDGSGAKKEMEGVEDSEERVVTAVSEKPDVMDVDDGGDSGSDAGWEEGSDDAGVDAHAEEGLSPPVSSAQLPETGVDDEEPASVSRREVLARYEGVTLTQIDAAEFNALPWHIQKELITALPRTRSGIKTAEASAAPDTANEGTASGRNGAEAGGDLDPQSFGPGNCQKSIAPLGEASTRETGAVVSARPMDSLPSLSQLDPLVLDALPLALKREIELAYGIVAPRAPPLKAPAKRTARGQGVRHAARPDAKLRRMDEFVTGQPRQAGLAARGQGGASGSRGVGTGVVTFSQVDPGVLDELPAELRTEIMQQLRPLPRAKAAARGAQRQRAAARAAAEAQEGLHAMRQEDSSDDEDGAGDEGGHEPLSQAFQGLVDSIDAASGLQDALKLLGEALTARECDKSDMVGGSPSQCSGPEGLPATHPSSEGPQGMEDTPQHGWSRVEASLVKLAKPLVASDLEAARRGLMRIQALAKAHAPFAATAQRVSSTLQRRITRRYGFPVSLRTLHKE